MTSNKRINSGSATARTPDRKIILTVLALVAAVLLAYIPSYDNGFINWDDDYYVVLNSGIQDGLTWDAAIWSLTSFYECNWHPLTWFSHALDLKLYGLSRPGGHHLTSVLFHALNTALLFLLLCRMTKRRWPASLVAGLFALHPLHVESVAWISERKDVLCTTFLLSALLAYSVYVSRRTVWRYLLVAACFTAALMCKPMAVTLPAVLLLFDFWPFRRLSGASLLEKIPLLALAVASGVVTVMAQRACGAVRDLTQIPVAGRLVNASYALVMYLVKMIWPAPGTLLPFYPLPQDGGQEIPLALAIFCACLLAGISGYVIYWKGRRPYLFTGWALYLIMLLPVLGLLQVGRQVMADRYTYVPLIGIFIALVWWMDETVAARPTGRTIFRWTSLAVLAVFGILSFVQQGIWGDRTAFWREVAEAFPGDTVSRTKLAALSWDRGERQDSIEMLEEAVAIRPDDYIATANLGENLRQMGRAREAAVLYEQSLSLKPDQATVLNGLGLALVDLGRYDEAISRFRRSAALDADDAGISLCNIGWALELKGDLEGAVRQYRSVIDRFPQKRERHVAHLNLGLLLLKLRNIPQAVTVLREAVTLQPNSPEAHEGLGTALLLSGDLEAAAGHLLQALSLNPNLSLAQKSLEMVRSRQIGSEGAVAP